MTLGEFGPKETAGWGERPGPKAGLFPSPHMVLGGELPWEQEALQTVGLWAVFWLGSAPTPLLLKCEVTKLGTLPSPSHCQFSFELTPRKSFLESLVLFRRL